MAESWSLEEYARHYNAIAEQYGGWRFVASEHDVENLKQIYEIGGYRSLREYAEGRFRYEQRDE
jgi:hypothetical protein